MGAIILADGVGGGLVLGPQRLVIDGMLFLCAAIAIYMPGWFLRLYLTGERFLF